MIRGIRAWVKESGQSSRLSEREQAHCPARPIGYKKDCKIQQLWYLLHMCATTNNPCRKRNLATLKVGTVRYGTVRVRFQYFGLRCPLLGHTTLLLQPLQTRQQNFHWLVTMVKQFLTTAICNYGSFNSTNQIHSSTPTLLERKKNYHPTTSERGTFFFGRI